MKLSTQEEYGLRCLLQIGRHEQESVTIAEISQAEGLSISNVGKFVRLLRLSGFVESERGHLGGYRLAHPSDQIMIRDVLDVLGSRLFGPGFCEEHAGLEQPCKHVGECSVRSLWNNVQFVVDQMLRQISLQDMLGSEQGLANKLQEQVPPVLQIAEPG